MDQDASPADQPTRRLVIVRHARAEGVAPSDQDRALTQRGHEDAAAAGRWLGARMPVGSRGAGRTQGLVSSARRAAQTWEGLVAGSGWGVEAVHDEALYVAGPDAALDLVRATSQDVTTLVLVGHNPTMGYLAPMLDDGEGHDEATTQLATSGFPTCTLAVLTLVGAWGDLDAGGARLEAFHVARADA